MEAKGEWITFLDDDDLWAPDKLARQLQAATAAGRDWVYAGSVNILDDYRIVYGRPPLSPEDVVIALPRYDAVPGGGSNVLVRRATWLLAGPFDVRLRNTEDWEMWIRLAKLGPPACVSSPLVARRLHRSNSSQDIIEITRGTKLIESLHRTTADWGRLHLWMGESCQRNGERWAALRQFAKAAGRGQLRAVITNLSAILKSRLWRVQPVEGQRARLDDPWTAAAAAWLGEFARIPSSSHSTRA
jgi:hypothetical protein